ncbi:MAG: hypothetical protein AAF830_02000 [Pseudomonadota bacterium]
MTQDIAECVGDPIHHQFGDEFSNLPEGLTRGHLRTVFSPKTREAVEYAHIFGGTFPDQTYSHDGEYDAWLAALTHTYGEANASGTWTTQGFVRSEESPDCLAWYARPVLLLLCRRRQFRSDAAEASLSLMRLDRLARGLAIESEVINQR